MAAWKGMRSMEVLTLALEGEMFALEAGRVHEILDQVPVTDVPGGPAFASGLINVRGKVVPLADLRLRFGMEPATETIDSRIVVIDVALGGELTSVGLRADKVYEVTTLESEALEETPRIGMRWPAELVRCIGKRGREFIAVLDVDRLFEEEAGGQAAA